jgi:predicted MFS family arabinose efflux permease
MVALWMFLYSRLPEAEKPDPTLPPLGAALQKVIRAKAYLPFCAYAFLLALFTGGCPILFGMIEKTVLRMSDGTVALLANMRLLGSILGFYLGGKAVERHGTKPVFLACHFGFGVILFLFLWRGAGEWPVAPILAGIEALFGMVWAASSVAFTVEMYALIPSEGKSLSTSVFMTLQGAGASLGGMLPAWAIRLGMFSETWTLAGTPRSDYDALLLICGTLVVVIAVTLGLVPSVTGRAQWPLRE